MSQIINSLYDHFKNTPKKLKIVCDWDEVIQACEPYALWKLGKSEESITGFSQAFKDFWEAEKDSVEVVYSPYGSSLILGDWWKVKERTLKEQQEIKNSPNFYQEAPFLTIAEDLLKLIKEDKVEKLIFLSAYDKRKFPNFDGRKIEIFHQTFNPVKVPNNDFPKMAEMTFNNIEMKLIPFKSETQGQTKADWIKENASDFDIVIDDNPNICKSVLEADKVKAFYTYGSIGFCANLKDYEHELNHSITVLAPYYPAIENQHHSEVLLVKNEVSVLKREDFGKTKI